MSYISGRPVRWSNTLFLSTIFLLTITAAPVYIWHQGLDWFQGALFLVYFFATGLSITLGYHRLYAHKSFQASWPVRLFVSLFGAASFENSILCWTSDHRQHHKFVDHDEDPYDITKGFFHAHIGWILFRSQPETDLENVKDLRSDLFVRLQHDYYRTVAIGWGLILPTVLGWVWGGPTAALGAFLIAGVTRVFLIQQLTFCINSLCHSIGRRPYTAKCTARDSGLMAIFTMGEGYHNFHHAFQHDYRNGVKAWQFDPTKWSIWLLHKLGLVRQLRRVPLERIQLAETKEQERQLTLKLETQPTALAEPIRTRLQSAQLSLHQAFARWERYEAEYRQMVDKKLEGSRERLAEIMDEFRTARGNFRQALQDWRETHRLVLSKCA